MNLQKFKSRSLFRYLEFINTVHIRCQPKHRYEQFQFGNIKSYKTFSNLQYLPKQASKKQPHNLSKTEPNTDVN